MLNEPLKDTRKIFFDDDRPDLNGWSSMRTSEQLFYFLQHIDGSTPVPIEILSMDHDIGHNNMSGYELLKEVIDNHPSAFDLIEEIRFHTNNMVGGRNMYHLIKNAQKAGVINQDLIINKTIFQYNDKRLLTTPFVWE